MKLLVDGVFFQLARTGIARVWSSVLPRLVRIPIGSTSTIRAFRLSASSSTPISNRRIPIRADTSFICLISAGER